MAGKRAGTRGVLLAAGRDKWPLPGGGPGCVPRADWMRAHPAGRLDIAEGETRLVIVLPEGADLEAGLAVWRDLARACARAAVGWRRRQRPVHGM